MVIPLILDSSPLNVMEKGSLVNESAYPVI